MRETSAAVASVLLVLCGACHARGQPAPASAAAVVQIPSHGGSGTVIATEPGRTWILTCAHLFAGPGDRARPLVILSPSNRPVAPPRRVGPRLVAIRDALDLALLHLPDGPLPFWAPVPPAHYRPDTFCWSVGYDEMRRPPQVRPARIVSVEGSRYLTDARPWHGRSGGALLEARTGYLVGVVTAYRGMKGPRGPRGPRGADPLFDRWERDPSGRGVAVALPPIAQFIAPYVGGR